MYYNYVGRSGLRVSALGLGTMTWGRGTGADVATDMLRDFADAGGTLIDTSSAYGTAQEVLGAALGSGPDREDLVLVSKSGIRSDRGEVRVDASRTGLLRQLDRTLSLLGTDHLDLWLAEAWDERVPLEETLSVLETAQRSGRTRYVGLANLSGWQLALAHASSPVPLVGTEIEYSLLQREAESELVPAARHLGVGVLASSGLGRGVLTGKYRRGIPRDSRAASPEWAAFVETYLDERSTRVVEGVSVAAAGLNFTPLEVSLGWLRNREGVDGIVTGPRTSEQLAEVLHGFETDVPEEILLALDEVSGS